LHLLTLDGTGEPIKLTLADNLYEARFEVNSDTAARTVKAQGWDPLHVIQHSGSASRPRSGRTAAAEAAPDHFNENGQRALADELAADDRHAQALAQAELDVRSASEVVLRCVAEGGTALVPGAIIEVEGVAPALVGRYVLTAVVHTINERLGFVSELSSEPPALPVRSRSSIVALGVVASVDDLRPSGG
jgi:phage protein D